MSQCLKSGLLPPLTRQGISLINVNFVSLQRSDYIFPDSIEIWHIVSEDSIYEEWISLFQVAIYHNRDILPLVAD